MIGIESRLKNFNQRNTDYYIKAFAKLDSAKQNTFNNAACIAPLAWMVFRKMYEGIFLFYLLWLLVFFLLKYSCSWIGKEEAIPITSIIMMLLWGRFGNRLYYRTVKARIVAGYHKIETYNAVSPLFMLCLAFSDISIFLGDKHKYVVLALFILLIVQWICDWRKLPTKTLDVSTRDLMCTAWISHFGELAQNTPDTPNLIDAESISQYLNKARYNIFW